MSMTKRNYEENFDTVVTYSLLKANGLTEDEIYEQWAGLSSMTWEEFKNT